MGFGHWEGTSGVTFTTCTCVPCIHVLSPTTKLSVLCDNPQNCIFSMYAVGVALDLQMTHTHRKHNTMLHYALSYAAFVSTLLATQCDTRTDSDSIHAFLCITL